tara:strand:+ start:680 stop:1348 length:669 start_codon:yes stop_codon:yes gene_type:complete
MALTTIKAAAMAANSVDSDQYVDASIDTAHIKDDQVTADKLANSINTEIAANTAKVTNATHTGDVTGDTALTIAADAVETGMIADANVTTAKIADDAVTSAKLDTNIAVAGTVSDSKGDLRDIVEHASTTSYTLVAADAGKYIKFTPGDANQTLTVPDSVFTSGDAVTIVNNSGNNLAIAKGTNMYYAADGTNANRTLAGRGVATLLFTAADTCYITGAGLS